MNIGMKSCKNGQKKDKIRKHSIGVWITISSYYTTPHDMFANGKWNLSILHRMGRLSDNCITFSLNSHAFHFCVRVCAYTKKCSLVGNQHAMAFMYIHFSKYVSFFHLLSPLLSLLFFSNPFLLDASTRKTNDNQEIITLLHLHIVCKCICWPSCWNRNVTIIMCLCLWVGRLVQLSHSMQR